MVASVVTLRAKGPQDAFLSSVPEVTFFRSNWARHTNFAIEDNFHTEVAGKAGFGQKFTFHLQRSGDLISQLYLHFEIPEVKFTTTSGADGAAGGYIMVNSGKNIGGKVFVDDLGRALIDKVTFRIGSYDIEQLTGDYMHVYDRISKGSDKSMVDNCPARHGGVAKKSRSADSSKANHSVQDILDTMHLTAGMNVDSATFSTTGLTAIGNDTSLLAINEASLADAAFYDSQILGEVNNGGNKQHIYVPLNFSNTCSNYGQSLPIIALQYHQAEIIVETKKLEDVSILTNAGSPKAMVAANSGSVNGDWTPGDFKCELVAKYIFLDDHERRMFATSTHEFLLTETNYDTFPVTQAVSDQKVTSTLSFNHPMKELIAYVIPEAHRPTGNTYDNAKTLVTRYWDFVWPSEIKNGEQEAFRKLNLRINNQHVFDNDGRDSQYFGWLAQAHYHTRCIDRLDKAYIMSFCLDPDNWKPTGSLNFSRLDTVHFDATVPGGTNGTKADIHVNARNFNIMKITSGMGGKKFAS